MKKYQEEIEELRRMLEEAGDEEEESESEDEEEDSDTGDVIIDGNSSNIKQQISQNTSPQKQSPSKSNTQSSPNKPPSNHEQSNGVEKNRKVLSSQTFGCSSLVEYNVSKSSQTFEMLIELYYCRRSQVKPV